MSTLALEVVFDDDAAGEAADLVCLKTEDEHIRLVLAHCKYFGSSAAGARVKDVVEVASQAVRSARWAGRFSQLCRHLRARDTALRTNRRRTRFIKGTAAELSRLQKLNRFRPIRPEIPDRSAWPVEIGSFERAVNRPCCGHNVRQGNDWHRCRHHLQRVTR